MGGAHSHVAPSGHDHGGPWFGRHDTHASRVMLGILAAVAAAAIVCMVILWPQQSSVRALRGSHPILAAGTTFVSATVKDIHDGSATVDLSSGPEKSQQTSVDLPPNVTSIGIGSGTHLTLTRSEVNGQPSYAYFAIHRGTSITLLVIGFVVVLLLVGRLRGVMALVGLAVSAAAMWYFVLPALMTGERPWLVAMSGAVVILTVVLYTTHGFRPPTTAALIGTLIGAAVTVAIGHLAVMGTQLTGVADDEGLLLNAIAPKVDLPEILVAAALISSLGALNDVTITQASAVWELHEVSPTSSRWVLWRSAMKIGRDHIASTVYTIVFAYVGGAVLTLMLLQMFDNALVGFWGTEGLVEELVRVLVASIGLVLAVPITTACAVLAVD